MKKENDDSAASSVAALAKKPAGGASAVSTKHAPDAVSHLSAASGPATSAAVVHQRAVVDVGRDIGRPARAEDERVRGGVRRSRAAQARAR